MNWLLAAALALGVLIWLSRHKGAIQPSESRTRPVEPKTTEEPLDHDGILKAVESKDLDQMAALMNHSMSSLDRHLLLTKIAELAYKQRKDDKMRRTLMDTTQRYLAEFDQMEEALKAEAGDIPIEAPCFKWRAIALEEDRLFDEAVDVCKAAQRWGLEDGTKTGFAGRIERIRKKQSAAES